MLTTTHYERNKEPDHLVGIDEEELNEIKEDELQEIKEDDEGVLLLHSFFSSLVHFGYFDRRGR